MRTVTMTIIKPTQRRYACTLLTLNMHSRPMMPGIMKKKFNSFVKSKITTTTTTTTTTTQTWKS